MAETINNTSLSLMRHFRKALTSSALLATRDAQPARGFVVGWSHISRRSVAAADAVAVELLSYNCRVVYECLDLRLVWLLVVLRRNWGRLPVSIVVVDLCAS